MTDIKIPIPKEVADIINLIECNKHEAYIVGGCVRDFFVGKTPKDYDITTSMLPTDVMNLFKKHNYNVIPTGLKHGTVTVVPKGSTEGYEITTYRTDGEYLDGRHPESVSFTTSLSDDLSRRDLTINAMAYSPNKGLVDIFGGLDDIHDKIIRTVGSPIDRFSEDALRMMRAVRFAAQLGYSIEDNTLNSIKSLSSTITQVSAERIHDELIKILMSDNPDYIRLLYDVAILKHIIPEVNLCFYTKQNNPWHLFNVGTHTMVALKNSMKDITLRMAILLHDIGKPHAMTTDENGINHFAGHADVSSIKALEIMKRLKFTTKMTEDVVLLTKLHDYNLENTPRALRRFINKYNLDERLFHLAIELKKADNLAQNPALAQERYDLLLKIEKTYESIKNQPMSVKDLNVSGYDLISLGLKGPAIGTELNRLLSLVLDNPELNEKEKLIELIKENLS